MLNSKSAGYPQLGGKRKVRVSRFKGKIYVNIREYYDDKNTGEEKPGNKGIALTLEQWERLSESVSEITQQTKDLS